MPPKDSTTPPRGSDSTVKAKKAKRKTNKGKHKFLQLKGKGHRFFQHVPNQRRSRLERYARLHPRSSKSHHRTENHGMRTLEPRFQSIGPSGTGTNFVEESKKRLKATEAVYTARDVQLTRTNVDNHQINPNDFGRHSAAVHAHMLNHYAQHEASVADRPRSAQDITQLTSAAIANFNRVNGEQIWTRKADNGEGIPGAVRKFARFLGTTSNALKRTIAGSAVLPVVTIAGLATMRRDEDSMFELLKYVYMRAYTGSKEAEQYRNTRRLIRGMTRGRTVSTPNTADAAPTSDARTDDASTPAPTGTASVPNLDREASMGIRQYMFILGGMLSMAGGAALSAYNPVQFDPMGSFQQNPDQTVMASSAASALFLGGLLSTITGVMNLDREGQDTTKKWMQYLLYAGVASSTAGYIGLPSYLLGETSSITDTLKNTNTVGDRNITNTTMDTARHEQAAHAASILQREVAYGTISEADALSLLSNSNISQDTIDEGVRRSTPLNDTETASHALTPVPVKPPGERQITPSLIPSAFPNQIEVKTGMFGTRANMDVISVETDTARRILRFADEYNLIQGSPGLWELQSAVDGATSRNSSLVHLNPKTGYGLLVNKPFGTENVFKNGISNDAKNLFADAALASTQAESIDQEQTMIDVARGMGADISSVVEAFSNNTSPETAHMYDSRSTLQNNATSLFDKFFPRTRQKTFREYFFGSNRISMVDHPSSGMNGAEMSDNDLQKSFSKGNRNNLGVLSRNVDGYLKKFFSQSLDKDNPGAYGLHNLETDAGVSLGKIVTPTALAAHFIDTAQTALVNYHRIHSKNGIFHDPVEKTSILGQIGDLYDHSTGKNSINPSNDADIQWLANRIIDDPDTGLDHMYHSTPDPLVIQELISKTYTNLNKRLHTTTGGRVRQHHDFDEHGPQLEWQGYGHIPNLGLSHELSIVTHLGRDKPVDVKKEFTKDPTQLQGIMRASERRKIRGEETYSSTMSIQNLMSSRAQTDPSRQIEYHEKREDPEQQNTTNETSFSQSSSSRTHSISNYVPPTHVTEGRHNITEPIRRKEINSTEHLNTTFGIDTNDDF